MKIINLLRIFPLGFVAGPTSLWAQQQPGFYHGPHMMWESGWMFFGPLMMLLFIALVVVVVVLIVRWLGGSRHEPARTRLEKTPLDVLKERFAKGEIDKEEFEERRRILEE